MICFSSVRRIYALGWCGSLHPDVKIGDVVVAYAAVRGDATSTWYIPLEYPAVAEPHDVLEVYEAAKREGLRTHMGIVYTTSSHMRKAEILEKWGGIAHCVECEVATLYTITRLMGIPSVAALVVSDSLVEKRRDPKVLGQTTPKLLKTLVKLACKHVRG